MCVSLIGPNNTVICVLLPQIPQYLVHGFLSGDKNPISCLMEYSTIAKVSLSFQEVDIEDNSGRDFTDKLVLLNCISLFKPSSTRKLGD